MEALTPASLVHYYDTRLRRILCGVRGFEQRSSKHSREVTCQACIGLLGKQLSAGGPTAPDAPPGVAP
jgi:hypothetical protein